MIVIARKDVAHHENVENMILINDNYNVSSIKDDKHDKRASKNTNIPNMSPKDCNKLPYSAKFKYIFLKIGNIVRLQDV